MKIEPMVHLNTNPCKMCMPLGVVTAFYGIKGSMSILHGSQGCSTYIRRHMATHYNEPIDIASSSLTEEGTVFGGEKNLLAGLKNMIEIYHPKVIGVSTTCLAETIGEDIDAMIDHFYQTNEQYRDIRIIPVHSPGYGGTQFEGYFQALYSLVSKVVMNQEANEYINVITAPMTPADTRKLKEAFALFSIPIILLPDVSDNLDGVFSPEYEKLPKEGTPIEEIEKMAGAWLTLELSGVFPSNTPGKYLEETYGVPLIQMNMPVGLEDTDGFYRMLSSISKKGMPTQVKLQRGRYLDAMIDAHKYNGEGRAVIYGEP
ncbi:MAG: nitrogen fixation protein NifN, partial [Clostridiales bacterium]|nr:nitrogen fixation protein NifN [Clostridiales bacterium]